MSTTTTNYEFIKPERTDPADITTTNENWDKIDTALIERDRPMSMGGYKITNVAEPESSSDVATRGFVENFSIEGSTYVAVDEKGDGNVVLRPYVPLVDDAADFVVELGTKDGWSYKKWNSGDVEVWREVINIPSVPTGDKSNEFTVYYPFTINNPTASVTSVRFGWAHIQPMYIARGTNSLNIRYYFDTTGTVPTTPNVPLTQCDFSFDVIVKGKWK